ncbi:MAG: AAA family ATPase, partial [Myxococcales bacterium]|nr:AAA family ATPase [Myxococcales bacterium]
NLVLDLMRNQGRIGDKTHSRARTASLRVATVTPDADDARYFLDLVRRRLPEMYDLEALRSEGLRIYSTLDGRLQRLAGIALREGLARLEARNPALKTDDRSRQLQGCIIAMRPQTGELLAMVGGRDYGVSQFDRCTQARRQVGSVFKPFVYLAALEPTRGAPAITLASFLDDSPLEIDTPSGPWRPDNYDGEFHGIVPVREALERSLNVATARLADRVKAVRIAEVARRLGILVDQERPKATGPVLVQLSGVTAKPIEWLWPSRIAIGKLTLLVGDPDLGKTFLALAISAAVTRGWPLPGEDGVPRDGSDPASVLYMTAEDGLADTLRPRIDAMGGDPSRFYVADGWQSDDGRSGELITLKDLDVLEDALERVKPTLFVLDPLFAYLGSEVDAHRANETRPLMTRLMRLAERFDCVVLGIRHLRKAEAAKAIYRGLGSIDFTASVRSILFVGEDPEQKELRVLAHAKSNLAAKGTSLAYEITPSGEFRWAGVSALSAEDLFAPVAGDRQSARSKAKEFLLATLADGPVRPPRVEELAEAAEISESTLKRAKRELGVVSEHAGEKGQAGGGEWYWKLPDEGKEARGPEGHTPGNEPLARLPGRASEHLSSQDTRGDERASPVYLVGSRDDDE